MATTQVGEWIVLELSAWAQRTQDENSWERKGTHRERCGSAWRLRCVEFHRPEEGREAKATHHRCARITFSRLSVIVISFSPLASCPNFTALVIALDRSFPREIWWRFDGILVSWKVRACGICLVDVASYRGKHFSKFFGRPFFWCLSGDILWVRVVRVEEIAVSGASRGNRSAKSVENLASRV